jgi:NAD(P)-dependent dehydrogenase (short-subunit alcohol dehydrogenase family)
MDRTAIEALFSVEGKIAVVTGGTSGIGKMMAQGLVAGGARVYLVARTAADCERTAAEFGASGECRPLAGDLSSLDGIEMIARGFCQAEDRLHILVHGAGLLTIEPLEEYSERAWDDAKAASAVAQGSCAR